MDTKQTIFRCHKLLMSGYTKMALNYDLKFDEPIPLGAKILVANHPTTTDPFLLPLLLNDPISILVTGVAFEVPVFGRIALAAGHIPVPDAADQRGQIIPSAVEQLKMGHAVGIFPEGHLSPEIGQFCPPRTGAARIALLSGAPVIPVGIALNKDGYFSTSYKAPGRWAWKGQYFVTVGSPMSFSGDGDDRARVRSVTEQIMSVIIQLAGVSASRMNAKTIHLPQTATPISLTQKSI